MLFKHLTFEVGETCDIWLANHSGKTTQGKVVAVLDLPGYSFSNYVIEIPTDIEPLLEIRHGLGQMFKKPIGHSEDQENES